MASSDWASSPPACWTLRRLAAQAPGPQLQPPRRGPRLLPRLGRRPAAPAGLAAAHGSADGRPTSGCRSSSTSPRPASCWTRPLRCPTTRGPSAAEPTYHAIFALCYGLGLRAGEACGLRLGDVDADRQLLVVRGGKFGKSRLVPHGPRIGELLARQVERASAGTSPTTRCSASTVSAVRQPVTARARPSTDSSSSWTSRSPTASPRHGCTRLRHSFAVGCLLRWYREGVDPASRLYQLSTFMGHVDPASTAVYLTITPQLLAEANRAVRGLRRTGVVGGDSRDRRPALGPLVHSFFLDHLVTVKGLRPASVRSYRDTIRLLLCFVAKDNKNQDHQAHRRGLDASSGSSASCATWRTSATTTSGPATSAWRPCTPCSTTSPPGNRRCSPSASRWRPSR